MSDEDLCAVCRRNTPEHGRACEADRETIAKQLYGIIGQVRRLEVELTPGARRGDGVRVSTSKGAAPVPARLDALSLVAPGSDNVTAMLNPMVRHWQTTRKADVTYVKRWYDRKDENSPPVPRAEMVTERRTIVEWHQELARDEAGNVLQLADDDQIGTLPPREWLASWVRAWQETFQQQVPRRMREVPWPMQYLDSREVPNTERALSAVTAGRVVGGPPRMSEQRRALAVLAADPATASAVAAMQAIRRQYDQAVLDTISGKTLGYGGDTSRQTRSDDPLEDDTTVRFGTSLASDDVARSVGYLLLWLDEACERPDVPIGDFAGELRSMSAELTRVLGERPDLTWLGRCPARITTVGDAVTVTRPCGAGLWQDPHASQVQCPRCHSTWGPRRVELLYLAQEMRRTWPVDRRRLYTVEERKVVRRIRCPGCGFSADIRWREATPLGSKVRVWQPVGAECVFGCDEANEAI